MNKTRQPLFHISKRPEISLIKSWGIRGLAIILGLLVCALITTITTGENPVSMFTTIVDASFGSERKLWQFFQDISILLCISIAVTPAFRMRCWNLGAEGQVLAGALATGACMIKLGDVLPQWAICVVMPLAAIAAGALWALIPAIFKAKWNTNETLFTLMMNYVAAQLVSYFVVLWENPKGSFNIGVINQKTKGGWLPQVYNKYLLVIIVVAVLTLFMYIYLRYTKHGYEIAVVGESERTARYIGIKVDVVITRTMLLSGALCGVAGLLIVGAINHTFSSAIVGGQGFTAVMVSWLAKFNPLIMVATSGLLIFMERGSGDISTAFGLNESFSDILTGVIIFFIIGSEFFINYKISFAGRKKEEN